MNICDIAGAEAKRHLRQVIDQKGFGKILVEQVVTDEINRLSQNNSLYLTTQSNIIE